ncbi:MAG: glycerate kinase [Kineosporiaceae bacterium]
MRVLVAPDCFTGTLTAGQAAAAMADGWHDHAPADEVEQVPLSDGGPGFVDVMAATSPGQRRIVTVCGPLGEPVPAEVLLLPGPDGPTAVVEAAQACGLHLVPAERRDPALTTTRGVGDLLLAAREAGARRIVVGLGGTATNDAGAGMLARLLAAAAPERGEPFWGGGGGRLLGVGAADLAGLETLAAHWRGIRIVAAADVDVPLLGFHGASAAFAAQKGASPAQAQHLERCLGDFAAAAEAVGAGLDPLALDRAARRSAAPHAGAGGGLGYGLMLLGGRAQSGAAWIVDAVGLTARAAAADLVLTGEGCLDWQSLRGKVVAGVAAACRELTTPVVAVAGQVDLGRREAQAAGIEASYAVARTAAEVAQSLADPAPRLRATVARVARTWSRPASG